MHKPLFDSAAASVKGTAVVIIGNNPDYNYCNYNPNPYSSVKYSAASAWVAAWITTARVTHCILPPCHMFLQPQPLLQQSSSLFMKSKITRMMNHKIVLLSLPQQPFLPNKPNITIPP